MLIGFYIGHKQQKNPPALPVETPNSALKSLTSSLMIHQMIHHGPLILTFIAGFLIKKPHKSLYSQGETHLRSGLVAFILSLCFQLVSVQMSEHG